MAVEHRDVSWSQVMNARGQSAKVVRSTRKEPGSQSETEVGKRN